MRTNTLLSFCLASLSIVAASPILGTVAEAEKHVDVPGAVTFDHDGQVERRGLYLKTKGGVELSTSGTDGYLVELQKDNTVVVAVDLPVPDLDILKAE
ncbi:hypothetical protein BKA70DRAFT_1451789 [Coprinopsis sp. MPI-PUGE-AT-0042]|nr:hypothetical protein BKA70DRAFT_1451789 [Coprinopsis sp. MPI-PUGE-AT-0042]